MPRIVALTVAVLLVFPVWSQDKDAVKKELDKLQGEWKLVAGEAEGVKIPENALDHSTLLVTGELYDFNSPAEKEKGKFTIKPGTNPLQIDMDITEGTAQGKKQLGIYEVKGDRVKFCMAQAGDPKRPAKFATNPEDKFMIFEFEKVKK
jgi:uncharacterized protein (TIGR03067 family)